MSQWPERLASTAQYTCQWMARPRVRLSLTGVLLLLIGAVFITNSVWTLPVVVVGALMVVVAWIGHRLEGRFAIEWGEGGTELAFRATIKPPDAAQEAARASSPSAEGLRTADPPAESPGAESEQMAADGGVIDGEAHTVEIDVAELKALLAAAETAGPFPQRAVTPATDIRIRRAAGAGDDVRSTQSAR